MPQTIRVTVPGEGVFLARDGLKPEHIKALLQRHQIDSGGNRCLKLKFGTVVTRTAAADNEEKRQIIGGDDVVVKSTLTPSRRRLAYRLGARSKFANSFEISDQLETLRVQTPPVVACSLRPRGEREFVVTLFLPTGRTVQELVWLSDTPIERSKLPQLLERLGTWMRSLHDAGVWQRDFKSDNVLVTAGELTTESFFLLDTSEIRFFEEPLTVERRARNLGQILDLPLKDEAEAKEHVLKGYGGPTDTSRHQLGREITATLAARRRQREKKTGFTYIDEEHYGRRGP